MEFGVDMAKDTRSKSEVKTTKTKQTTKDELERNIYIPDQNKRYSSLNDPTVLWAEPALKYGSSKSEFQARRV